MATPKSLDSKEHRRRLQRQADIEMAIDCHCPVDRAIELVTRRRNISPEGAWDAIKLDISLGKLPAQCIDDRGERVAFAPHWINSLAKFQLPTEPGTLDQPIGTVGEFLRFSDFPSGGILWFDHRRAVENRLARKITEDNRAEPSLPPVRVRDVVVEEVRLDELYPENVAEQIPDSPRADATDTERSDAFRRDQSAERRAGGADMAPTLWTWDQALAWCLSRDLALAANPPWRPSVAARYPKPDCDGHYPPVYGTVAEFRRAVDDGLLSQPEPSLFDAAQVMRVFPAPAAVAEPLPSDSERVDRARDNAIAVTRKPQRGPKQGTTGFSAADLALCPDIDNMVKRGEARSAIAAARVLVQQGRVAGNGGEDSRATRVARRYGHWKSEGCPQL